MVAWFALAILLAYGGASLVWQGATNSGGGWWHFYGYEDYRGVSGDEHWGKLPEKQYKRQCYMGGGVLLLFSGIIFRSVIAEWRKRNDLEESWQRSILDPEKLLAIQQNPEIYREDFRQWIKENHPPSSE